VVKPCENEECGRPFIAKRRDTRFCSASCRARAHTLKSRREYLLARTSAAAGVEVVVPPATPATARLERRVRGLEAALEGARVEAVRGLGELASELRVGRDQAADACRGALSAGRHRGRGAGEEDGGGTNTSARSSRSRRR
jgi:hypothetical protein